MPTTKQILAEINAKLAAILAAVCPECEAPAVAEPVKKPWTTPFGEPGQPGGGQVFPTEEPTPAPAVEVWPVVDYSEYKIGACKSCVTYYGILNEHGFPGLVAEIRKYWDKQDTFYQPIKDFMRDYPELFPCKDCK